MSEAKPPPFEEVKPYNTMRWAPYNNIGAWLRYLDKRVDELKDENKKKETEEFHRRLRSQINGYNEIIWHCKSSELREQLEAARADCIKKLVNSYGGRGVMAEDYAHSGFALGAGAKPFTPPTHRTNEELRVEQEIKMGLMPSYIARRTTAEKLSVHGAPVQKPPPISEINAGGEVCAEVFKNIGAWLEHTDKRVDELQAMSNAHGAPVQDAKSKSKYGDALAQLPVGAQQLRKPGEPERPWAPGPPQQTVGEAIQFQTSQGCIQALHQQQYAQASADYKVKKDPYPMDKTEVAKMIEEEREKINKYVLGVNSRHIDFYHTPEPAPEPACKPYKAPRSRASLYIAGYLLAAMGTFVHVQHYNDSYSKITDGGDRVFISVVVPPFWPVYWAEIGLYYVGQGVLALDTYIAGALKPAPKAPAKSCTDDKSGSWAPDAEGVCHMPALSTSPTITFQGQESK